VLIEGSAPAIRGESDPADVLPAIKNPVQVSQPGDLWILGRHRIYCGNSLENTSYTMMEGDGAHAIFTDPPYNVRDDASNIPT
jgi:hypothetical protein